MMGFFSNLFAKQNCAVCGKECGTLHRSKLRDGQFLCDDCGNKCSKYIRLSELTLDEAKEHMEYMARMKRVFDEVFNKTEFRVNEYPSTPTQMGLVFCDELGMLYIDDRTGGRGKMPELIRYDQIASYEEYLDETPAKEPGQEPTLNGGGLKQLIYGNIKAFKGPNGQIYQRRSTARLPIKKLSSNSIPKMIGNEEKVYGVVKPSIDRNLQHYVEQQIELLTK